MLRLIFACMVLAAISLMAQTTLIPSQVGTAPLTNEAPRSNVLSYGTTVSGSFDDNVTNPTNPTRGEDNFSSTIQPQARLTLNRSRWNTGLYYGPSFTYSSNISSYNSTAHAAGADFEYHFTRRLSVISRNTFSLTSSPYESLQANAQLPDLGVLNRQNSNAVGTDVRSRVGQSQADMIYLLGPHTSVGIGGTFNASRTESLNTGLTADLKQNYRGWSGHGVYSHQQTKRYSFGVQYTARDSSSDATSGQFSSLSHQVLGFVNIAFRPSVQLSLFAGPELSGIDETLFGFATPLPINFHQSTFAGGSTLSWRGEHSGTNLSFVQQVGDSGLNGAGPVVVRTVNLDAQHRLNGLSTISLHGSYISNTQFERSSQLAMSDYAAAGVSLSRVLTQRLTLQISGVRQQLLGRAAVGFQQRSHDIASVSLSYTFQQPIGR